MKILKLILLLIIITAGCLKNKTFQFCEGTNPEGKGVNCGIKFTTGDFNAVLNVDNPFGVDSLNFILYTGDTNKARDSYTVQVKPEETSAQATISIDNAGTYKVVVTANNDVLAEETIEIVEMN